MKTTDSAEGQNFGSYIDNYILDSNNKPKPEPSVQRWSDWWLENMHRTQVARTKVGASLVSTVFLRFNHGIPFDKLLLYETAIKKKKWHIVCRYSTKKEALSGHRKWVSRLKSELAKKRKTDKVR